jgi:hypothetical protein
MVEVRADHLAIAHYLAIATAIHLRIWTVPCPRYCHVQQCRLRMLRISCNYHFIPDRFGTVL